MALNGDLFSFAYLFVEEGPLGLGVLVLSVSISVDRSVAFLWVSSLLLFYESMQRERHTMQDQVCSEFALVVELRTRSCLLPIDMHS